MHMQSVMRLGNHFKIIFANNIPQLDSCSMKLRSLFSCHVTFIFHHKQQKVIERYLKKIKSIKYDKRNKPRYPTNPIRVFSNALIISHKPANSKHFYPIKYILKIRGNHYMIYELYRIVTS